MTLTFLDIVPIVMLFLLYFMGMPIVYSLFGATFFYFLVIDTTSQPWLILQKVMNSTQSYSMLAIPFFIMSGSVMNYGGISDKMMDFAECLTGHMKGGLAQVNVVLSMLMGGCSGSANADCAMQSKMLVPEMEKRGYSKAFSAAITAASSAATPVIPPGVNLIVFCLIAQASLGRTFAAGYVPGILMSISMMITVAIISHKRNYPKSREKFPSLKIVLKQALDSFWGLFFPIGIILGIRFGMFTPSEGGAVAVLYCFIIGSFVYKRLSLRKHLIPILMDSIAGTAWRCAYHGGGQHFRQLHELDQSAQNRGQHRAGAHHQQVRFPDALQCDPAHHGHVPGRRRGPYDHHTAAAARRPHAGHKRLPLRSCGHSQHYDRRHHSLLSAP